MELDYFEAEGWKLPSTVQNLNPSETALSNEEHAFYTIQLDFLLPERFDLKYIGAGRERTPSSLCSPWVLSQQCRRFAAITY